MDPDREHDDRAPAPGPQSTPEQAEAGAPREPVAEVAAAAPMSADARPAGEAGAPTSAADESTPPDARDAAEPDPADTLSPAVRRLVRQYDLDITGIHGTGPAGKIRVGDVIGMLGGRAEPSVRASETPRGAQAQTVPVQAGDSTAGAMARAAPTTTVFDCDLSRVLSHRKRERRNDAELSLTTYFVAACADALRAVPEIAVPKHAGAPRLGVLLANADGGVRRSLVVANETGDDGLRRIDGQLRASGDDDLGPAQLWIHHYGPSGSLLATATELGAGHAASLGIGRVRREIAVKAVDGEEAPRVTARCYVTLTFRPEQIALARANQFVATLVRVLEQWPAEPTSA